MTTVTSEQNVPTESLSSSIFGKIERALVTRIRGQRFLGKIIDENPSSDQHGAELLLHK